MNKWKYAHFVILTMTYSDCWTLLLIYLKYLLNINFEHVYIVFYLLN
jgi:membrane protein DedA with SNARE-associated domain